MPHAPLAGHTTKLVRSGISAGLKAVARSNAFASSYTSITSTVGARSP